MLHIYRKTLQRDSHERENNEETQKEQQLSRPRLERGTFQIRSRRTECLMHRILLLSMHRTRATNGVRSYLVLGNHFVTTNRELRGSRPVMAASTLPAALF